MGEAIRDDPFWFPAEMVADRREVSKREILAVLVQAFENVKLGGNDNGRANVSESDERADQAPHGDLRT